jgi:CheY-like chemotaxis protein
MAPRYTILIADDESGVRRLVQLTIASDAYLLLEAADGDEAWETLQVCRPDVVLLDVMMPGRDGFALTRAIRADPYLASTRIILLTGRQEPDAVAQAYGAGVDHYLTKPFSPLHLLATIQACLVGKRVNAGWLATSTHLAADWSAGSAFTALCTAAG